MKHYRVVGITTMIAAALLSVSALAAEERIEMGDRFCQTCHGTDGIGNEGIQAPRLAGMEPWYLKRQLELFRDGLRGKHPEDIEGMEMQPMAEILDDKGIEDVVAWAASWEYVPAEPTLSGDVQNGRALYRTCASCHGDQAQGNEGMNAPALQGQNDWYLVTQLKNFKAGYRGNEPQDGFGTQMRAMAQMLPDEKAIIDVVSYINTLGR
jgi:cytochrome c553